MRERARRKGLPLLTRAAIVRISIVFLFLAVLLWAGRFMIRMPGTSHQGPLPLSSSREAALRGLLEEHVVALAGRIGTRCLGRHHQLVEAARSIEAVWSALGYQVERQGYEVSGKTCHNLEVEIRGTRHPEEIFVVGAHYDTVWTSPGANDNATGVASLLALARAFAGRETARTLRFVAFVNEEPPHFQTGQMGSRVYARRCRQRGENIIGMWSLETMGFYSDEEGSQSYPFPLGFFYPSRGNFIAFVGNLRSTALVKRTVALFRGHARFPSEGGAVFGALPGAGWSDHWSFWREGYRALMVTDTALFRYPHYHGAEDTPDKIDYDRLARVVAGLEKVLDDLLAEGLR